MDFSAYAEAGNDRNVLRWITDEIMNAVIELSAQEYVDVYGTSAKAALDAGRPFRPAPVIVPERVVLSRPSRCVQRASRNRRFRM